MMGVCKIIINTKKIVMMKQPVAYADKQNHKSDTYVNVCVYMQDQYIATG